MPVVLNTGTSYYGTTFRGSSMSDACGVMNWKRSREFWKLYTVAVFIALPAVPGKVAHRQARFALPVRTVWKFIA